jgi:hypothetical protein
MPDAAACYPLGIAFGRYRNHHSGGRVLNPDSPMTGNKIGRDSEQN